MNDQQRIPLVQVVGHIYSATGMGSHPRFVGKSLAAAGIPFAYVDIYGHEDDRAFYFEGHERILPSLEPGIAIFCINGDQIHHTLEALGGFHPDAYNIVYPAWELSRYPEEWTEQVNKFHEVWAISQFVFDSLSAAVSPPVYHLPTGCSTGKCHLRSRRDFGLRDDAYVFMFPFDFSSYIERKNPYAILTAFRKALDAEPYLNAQLVIKTQNSRVSGMAKEFLRHEIEPIKNHVVWIDKTLKAGDMKALCWLSDCFVSLHRSEGFGLGVAEPMALGKPVITTGFSGNMDFCTEENCFLVPYTLVPVRRGSYPHWENQQWAEPDTDVASRTMLNLVKNPELGLKRGAVAAIHMRKHFSYLPRGVSYANRLKAIAADGWKPRKVAGNFMK